LNNKHGEVHCGVGGLQGAEGGNKQEQVTELSFGDDQRAAEAHQK
jgi:hypothetical protein